MRAISSCGRGFGLDTIGNGGTARRPAPDLSDDWSNLALVARLALEFGVLDIHKRYRANFGGPLIISVAHLGIAAIICAVLAPVFRMDYMTLLPYAAVSNALWICIANCLTASPVLLRHHRARLLSRPHAPYVFPSYQVASLMLSLLHDLAPPLLIVAVTTGLSWTWLLAFPALVVWIAAAVALSTALSLLGVRYPIHTPIAVGSVTQLLVFATPIFWLPSQLGDYAWIQTLNPVFVFIDIVREPLLGQLPALSSWAAALLWTLACALLAVNVACRLQARATAWLVRA